MVKKVNGNYSLHFPDTESHVVKLMKSGESYTQWTKFRAKIIRLTRRFSMAQMVVPGMVLTVRVVKKFSIREFFVYRPPKFGKSVIFDPKNTI